MNGYGTPGEYRKKRIPPGWSTWATDWTPGPVRRFYGYRLNVNGKIRGPFGKVRHEARRNKDRRNCPAAGLACDYHTDQITTRALGVIATKRRQPLYLQIDFQAPHGSPRALAEPAVRHLGSASRTRLPRPPGFNEMKIGDKPAALQLRSRRLKRSDIARLRIRWQRELESLRAVDESVGRIIRGLRRNGRLRKTWIFFLSDNGSFFGQHRYHRSKFLAYEPSANVPLLVRGPGAKRGRRSPAIVSNVDLAPTIASLAGARLLLPTDGRSIRPLFRAPSRIGSRAILIEYFPRRSKALHRHLTDEGGQAPAGSDGSVSALAPAVNYTALRAGRYKYIRYESGGRELYDLRLDRGEQSNRVRWPAYRNVVRIMERQLRWRRFCAGKACRKPAGRLPGPKPNRR